nr:MerR family transcriptional regulator [Bacteriovorax sp. HI3]
MKTAKAQSEAFYTIGELAEKVGVNVETIRFYERQKIIYQPKKDTGRRKYSAEFVEHLKFIKQAQKVGFSLTEIKEFMSLKLNPNKSCISIKNKTSMKIDEVTDKIKNLQKMLKLLKKFESKCDGNETTGKCTILDGLKEMEL